MVGAVAVVAGLRSTGNSGKPAAPPLPKIALPTPHQIRSGGATFTVAEVAPVAAAPDPSNPRAVKIFAWHVDDPSDPTCSDVAPSAQVVQEDAHSITVVTFVYRVPVPKPAPPENLCYTSGGMYAALTLQLRSPLGERSLHDVKTGKAIGVIDGKGAPTPAYLPAGYLAISPRDAVLPGFDLFPVRAYRKRNATIVVRAESATYSTVSGRVVRRADVKGRTATVRDDGPDVGITRCVSWADQREVTQVVCSDAQSDAILSVDELLKVARSLS